MKELIKKAKYLIDHKKVEKIGENGSMGQLYTVDNDTVRIYPKPGRKMMSCTCPNFTMFNNQPRVCHHIIAALLFESHLPFYNKIDELIELYKTWKESDIEADFGIMIMHLEDLRRIK